MQTNVYETELVFDGDNRGIYIGDSIQHLASRNGWKGEPVSVEDENFSEVTDEAIAFLNDHVASGENCYWLDGSFFYGIPEGGCDG